LWFIMFFLIISYRRIIFYTESIFLFCQVWKGLKLARKLILVRFVRTEKVLSSQWQAFLSVFKDSLYILNG
jgi:hypothetical protein